MKFQVPQFIGVEDKIFGPLTAKQFLYLGGAAGAGFIIWSLIPIKIVAVIIAAPIVGILIAFAFVKYNDQPFIKVTENAFRYFTNSKIYIWKKVQKTPQELEKTDITQELNPAIPKLSDSKLKDLSWSLDIKEDIEN